MAIQFNYTPPTPVAKPTVPGASAIPATPATQTGRAIPFKYVPGAAVQAATVPAPEKPVGFLGKVANVAKNVGSAVISSETSVGKDLTAGTRAGIETNSENQLQQSQNETEKTLTDLIAKQKAEGRDSSHAEQTLASVRNTSIAPKAGDFAANIPESTKTNAQGLGDVAGVGLDVLSGGTYGKAAAGAKSFELLSKSGQVAAPVVKKTLGDALIGIGKKTAVRSGVGAATGYAYDVANNLSSGKTGTSVLKPGAGTVGGATIPLAIGAVEAGAAITKDLAPRLINSLIKPKMADFSYGKDPGRTVAKMGITGNNLEDFSKNLGDAKTQVGTQIGDIYKSPANADLKIDASGEISKIDKAIADAAKGGKENQGIVNTLQNTKDAILYEHRVNADGVIERVGTTPRDLSALSPQEAFDLKKTVAEQTKFTGKPSDDKTVNSVLKNIYGGLKTKLNNTVGVNNPEITDLNQKYADLTSAQIATANRDAIMKKANLMTAIPYSKPISAGIAAGSAILATGGAALPAVMVGLTGAGLEKAMETTAVRTRVAAWLGKESPSVIQKVLEQNPGLKTAFYRLVPQLSSKIEK